MALENIKLLCKSKKVIIKLFNDYSSILFEAKYKTIHGKGISSMLACIARVACVAEVSNHKIRDHSNLTIQISKY